MNERVKLNDNPSVETQLYVMGGAINRLLENNKNLQETVDQIRVLQREQNGNVSLALDRIGRMERRQDAHDDWHGDEDEKLQQRLHQEELEEAERRGHDKGIKKILGLEYGVVKWLIGGGLGGLGLGKVINIAGWW